MQQQSCHSLLTANIALNFNHRVLCQGLVAVSVGDLIRNEVKQRTYLGAKLQVRGVKTTIQTNCYFGSELRRTAGIAVG